MRSSIRANPGTTPIAGFTWPEGQDIEDKAKKLFAMQRKGIDDAARR